MASSNPRKFADKIRNLERKQNEDVDQFEQIMASVRSITSNDPVPPGAPGMTAPMGIPIPNQGLHPPPQWIGGSLPNVHEIQYWQQQQSQWPHEMNHQNPRMMGNRSRSPDQHPTFYHPYGAAPMGRGHRSPDRVPPLGPHTYVSYPNPAQDMLRPPDQSMQINRALSESAIHRGVMVPPQMMPHPQHMGGPMHGMPGGPMGPGGGQMPMPPHYKNMQPGPSGIGQMPPGQMPPGQMPPGPMPGGPMGSGPMGPGAMPHGTVPHPGMMPNGMPPMQMNGMPPQQQQQQNGHYDGPMTNGPMSAPAGMNGPMGGGGGANMSPLQSPMSRMSINYGFPNGSPMGSPHGSPHGSTLMLDGGGGNTTPMMELSPPGTAMNMQEGGSLPNLQQMSMGPGVGPMNPQQQQPMVSNGGPGYHPIIGQRHSTGGGIGPRLVPGPILTPESQSAPTSPANTLDPMQPQWPSGTRTFSNSPESLDIPKVVLTNPDGAHGTHVECFNDLQHLTLTPTEMSMMCNGVGFVPQNLEQQAL